MTEKPRSNLIRVAGAWHFQDLGLEEAGVKTDPKSGKARCPCGDVNLRLSGFRSEWAGVLLLASGSKSGLGLSITPSRFADFRG